MISGSPHSDGCTIAALNEISSELNLLNVSSKIIKLGTGPFESCRACFYCKKNDGCVIQDIVNDLAKECQNADAIILGSSVHYAGISGAMKTVLDRLFMSNSKLFMHKPGAAVVSCRRAGSTAALDILNKYFTINNMPIVSSQYWNMVHGSNSDEASRDFEGMQTMRQLARNLAWEIDKNNRFIEHEPNSLPSHEKRIMTNFNVCYMYNIKKKEF